MSYPVNVLSNEAEHMFNVCCGIESLAARMRAGDELKAITGQEHYALTMLELHDVNIRDIDGAEGLVQSAIRTFMEGFDWLGKRIFGVVFVIGTWVESKITTAAMRSITNEKKVINLARMTVFTPEEIVDIIKNPSDVEARIKKLEANISKEVTDGKAFRLPQAALYPVIALAKQSKGNGALVEKAIKSAGSIDSLIRKHTNEFKDIEMDTSGFTKMFDLLTKDKEDTVDAIIAKLDTADSVIAEADSHIKGDIWLHTFPKDLRKNFDLTKNSRNSFSIVKQAMLKNITMALEIDVRKLKKLAQNISSSDKNAEQKLAAASKILKIYASIIDEVVDYERRVVKGQNQADAITAEALYRIIITAAKAEVKA